MQIIPVTEIAGIRIGQTENVEAGTGCTVFISEKGMQTGLDVRGGGPASRESQLLNPLMSAQAIHAVVLAGGSASGLGTADGVMEYMEEHGYGYDVGVTKVPLVVQSDIFDLTVEDMKDFDVVINCFGVFNPAKLIQHQSHHTAAVQCTNRQQLKTTQQQMHQTRSLLPEKKAP